MLTVRLFLAAPAAPGEREATALKRVQAATGRFPDTVELQVIDLEDDAALDFGVAIAPTIMVGDTVISVGEPPLAGQIKRFIELELGAS
jgi:hypothetical protein